MTVHKLLSWSKNIWWNLKCSANQLCYNYSPISSEMKTTKIQIWLFQKGFDHIVWHQSITQHGLAGYYEDQRDVCGPWKQSREVGDQLASSITLTRTFPFHQHIDAIITKYCPIWNQDAKFWKINMRLGVLESKAVRLGINSPLLSLWRGLSHSIST